MPHGSWPASHGQKMLAIVTRGEWASASCIQVSADTIISWAIRQHKIRRRLWLPNHDPKISPTAYPNYGEDNFTTRHHRYIADTDVNVFSGDGLMCGDGSGGEMKSESCSTVGNPTCTNFTNADARVDLTFKFSNLALTLHLATTTWTRETREFQSQPGHMRALRIWGWAMCIYGNCPSCIRACNACEIKLMWLDSIP